MKKVLFLMSLVCFTLVGLSSCGSDKEDEVTPTESINSPTKSIDTDAGQVTIGILVSSSADWSASTDADWCSVDAPSTGTAGDVSLSVSIKKNSTGAERHANLILKTAKAQTVIPINQAK